MERTGAKKDLHFFLTKSCSIRVEGMKCVGGGRGETTKHTLYNF